MPASKIGRQLTASFSATRPQGSKISPDDGSTSRPAVATNPVRDSTDERRASLINNQAFPLTRVANFSAKQRAGQRPASYPPMNLSSQPSPKLIRERDRRRSISTAKIPLGHTQVDLTRMTPHKRLPPAKLRLETSGPNFHTMPVATVA